MSELTEQNTVAEWVLQSPGHSRIFERMGIDYCCGGKLSLSQACAEKGLDARTVVQTLAAMKGLGAEAGGDRTDWSQATLTALTNHIEQTHHEYLKEEFPRLNALLNKVASVHGERHPELHQVKQAFTAVMDELLAHMPKEERILFPAIRMLEASQGEPVTFGFGSVANPIRMMMMEHESTGNNLAEMNRLTGGYMTPADGCNSYRALMDGLKQLEEDTHLHIHKENNILFPRAIALEESRR